MNHRTILRTAGILGTTGVGLGAFGAHKLQTVLAERGMTGVWETAVRYHLLHAVALLFVAVWVKQSLNEKSAAMAWIARTWIAGTVLFSGSLYGLALGGPRWLGPVTPLGGICLIAGWIIVIFAGSPAARKT